jgi:hypothetical protein
MQGLELCYKADMRDDLASRDDLVSKSIRSIDTEGEACRVSSTVAKPVQGSPVGGEGGSGAGRRADMHPRQTRGPSVTRCWH